MDNERTPSRGDLGGNSVGGMKQEATRTEERKTTTYYNPNHIFRISTSNGVRPYLRDKHCWYERDMKYRDKLYAHVTLILGGDLNVQWLVPHKYLINTTLENQSEYE